MRHDLVQHPEYQGVIIIMLPEYPDVIIMPADLMKKPVSLAQDHAEMDVLKVKDSDGQVRGKNHCHQDQVPLQFAFA